MLFEALPVPIKSDMIKLPTRYLDSRLKGFYKGKSETFKGFEFVDQLVAHLPPRRVQLVRRYGVYAGKVRKQ
jgi:hypothetical protein